LLLAVFLVLPISASSQISPDPQIMAEVNQIKAVDNHTHVPKVVGRGRRMMISMHCPAIRWSQPRLP